MGRRSRKRTASSPSAAPAPSPATPARPPARSRLDGPPPAPWGSFPLVELCVLLALVLGIAGIVVWGRQGQIMLACAASVGSLAGLELAIREHWAGYRSHTSVLAGVGGVAAMALCFFLGAPQAVLVGAGVAVFAIGFWLLRGVFRRRSGGLSFRA